jgi:hypothetical protein
MINARFVSSLAAPATTAAEAPAPGRGPAFEVNLLWPFFPGGISDIKLVVPLLRAGQVERRGDLVVGLHSDFATRFVRPDERYGKVSILALKLGYRQFVLSGLHVDATVNAGWRHELHNVWDGSTLDAFIARLWLFAGYQHDFGRRVYANARVGVGLHLYRSDRFASKERQRVPAGDLNLGFRF